jgi:hypothetical protein
VPGPDSGRGGRRRRAAFETLEERLTPSAITLDTATPVAIPLGNVQSGQTVALQVVFTTTDNINPDDRTEGEPLVINGP